MRCHHTLYCTGVDTGLRCLAACTHLRVLDVYDTPRYHGNVMECHVLFSNHGMSRRASMTSMHDMTSHDISMCLIVVSPH